MTLMKRRNIPRATVGYVTWGAWNAMNGTTIGLLFRGAYDLNVLHVLHQTAVKSFPYDTII